MIDLNGGFEGVQAVNGLHFEERGLLADHLLVLESALYPGLTRINWNSLTISDFAAAVNKVRGGSPDRSR